MSPAPDEHDDQARLMSAADLVLWIKEQSVSYRILLTASGRLEGQNRYHDTDSIDGRPPFREKAAENSLAKLGKRYGKDWQLPSDEENRAMTYYFIELGELQKLIRKDRNGFWTLTWRGKLVLDHAKHPSQYFKGERTLTWRDYWNHYRSWGLGSL